VVVETTLIKILAGFSAVTMMLCVLFALAAILSPDFRREGLAIVAAILGPLLTALTTLLTTALSRYLKAQKRAADEDADQNQSRGV
jgi:hypothetical protein